MGISLSAVNLGNARSITMIIPSFRQVMILSTPQELVFYSASNDRHLMSLGSTRLILGSPGFKLSNVLAPAIWLRLMRIKNRANWSLHPVGL